MGFIYFGLCWLFLSIIAPLVFFRFLAYCARRHGQPEDEITLGAEEIKILLSVILLSPALVPLMLFLMAVQRITESERESIAAAVEWVEALCNKVNSKRLKEKSDE